MTSAPLTWISNEEMSSRVSMETAIRAVQRAFLNGLDPAHDFQRSIVDVKSGQLLYMPSQFGDYVGAKVSTLAPQNPSLGKERIQGIYVLIDANTLEPIMLVDAHALTALRTPAVSAAIADHLAPAQVDHLVVFGSGTQAWGHVQAMSVIRDVARVSIVARDPAHGTALVTRILARGLDASLGVADDVRDANVVICATASRSPLFDGNLVPDDSLTVAVGSHEPEARELDSTLIARSQLVVEDVTVALREAGDVIIPLGEHVIRETRLVPMRDILTGAVPIDHHRPRVFKSSGMGWQDLCIATEIFLAG